MDGLAAVAETQPSKVSISASCYKRVFLPTGSLESSQSLAAEGLRGPDQGAAELFLWRNVTVFHPPQKAHSIGLLVGSQTDGLWPAILLGIT